MKDTITIRDLEVHYRVGVPESERRQPQRLLVSLEMEVDFGQAAETDDLSATVDYYEVSRRLLAFGEGREWKLIERLASDLAECVLTEFKPPGVTVEVKKFILPEAKYVAVRARRGRTAAGRSGGPCP